MLVLDFLLLIAIGICIGYSWMLNRRIQDLQNSRIEFARMIKELNASIIRAEISVGELKELGKVTSSELKVSIESAKTTASELMMMNDIGNNLADVLSEQILVIKKDQKISHAQSSDVNNMQVNTQNQEFFDDSDIIDDMQSDEPKYGNNLKSFIHNHNMNKSEESINLNQSSYYNTLRKISVKK